MNYYRSFGDISSNSVVTDIYNKKLKYRKKKKYKEAKCIVRPATLEEREKYGIKD